MNILLLITLVGYLYMQTNASDCYVVSNTTIHDRRPDKSKLRIMQYNVEWLFIDYYSPMDCPGNGCTWKNETEAAIHMEYVSNVVKYINPDIINLCEVEGCHELQDLISETDISYIPYLIQGTDSSTGQNVGMLTRIDPISNLIRNENRYTYPLPNSSCGYTGPSGTTGLSKHYISEFMFMDIKVVLIAAHLLAYPTDPTRCAEREAQAYLLQTIIYKYILNEYEIIVMGDFNDYDAEIKDINNNIPTSRVLDIIKGTYLGEYELYNMASRITQHDRYSDWWDSDNNCNTASQKDYSLIDHILVSNKIQEHVHNVFIYHNYTEFCGKYNSDHYPVIIDLLF